MGTLLTFDANCQGQQPAFSGHRYSRSAIGQAVTTGTGGQHGRRPHANAA